MEIEAIDNSIVVSVIFKQNPCSTGVPTILTFTLILLAESAI